MVSALTSEGPETSRSRELTPAPQVPASARAVTSVRLVRFVAGRGPGAVRRVARGEHVTVTVEVDQPGQVVAPELGLSAPANPRTPASLDLFAGRPGRFALILEPTDGILRRAGTLVVSERRTR